MSQPMNNPAQQNGAAPGVNGHVTPATGGPKGAANVTPQTGAQSPATGPRPAGGNAPPTGQPPVQQPMGGGMYNAANPYGSMAPGAMGGYSSMGPAGYSSMGPSAYNGYAPGSVGPGAMGSLGDGAGAGAGSFMGNPQQASMYGNNMYGAGSMYGNNMYGSMNMQPMMMGSAAGSMYSGLYGPGGMVGSVYGGSMYGGGSMGGHFTGSLYGGSFFGNTGSLYGDGGAVYGSTDVRSVMSSMYGMGSMYEGYRSHTDLGEVRKSDLKYSITFGSQNLGERKADLGSYYGNDAGSASSSRDIYKQNSLRQGCDSDPTVSSMTRRASVEARGGTYVPASDKRSADTEAPSSGAATAAVAKRSAPAPAHAVPADEEAEAPKSPTTAAPGALSTTFSIHTVAVIEKSTSAMARVSAAGSNKVQVSVKGEKKDIAFEEVVSYDVEKKPALQSARVADMLSHYHIGHNAALLIAADKKASASSSALAIATVKQLFQKLEQGTSANRTYAVDFTLCAVQPGGDVRDLLKPGSKYVPLEIGASPLFGPVIMDLDVQSLKSAADFEPKFTAGHAVAKKDNCAVVGTLILKQTTKPASKDGRTEMLLSSLLLIVTEDGTVKLFNDVAKKVPDTPLREVLRYGVGGPCVTVLAACVSDSSDNSEPLLSEASKMSEVANASPRSGNVRRFVEHTDRILAALKSKAAKQPPAERQTMERNAERLSSIITDYQLLLDKPEETKPKVYRSKTETVSIAAPLSTAGIAGSANGSRNLPAEVSAAAGATNSAAPSAITAIEKENPDNAIRTVLLVDGDSVAAFKIAVEKGTLTVGGTPHKVDEVKAIKDATATSVNSHQVDNCIKSFMEGYNACILCADSKSIAPTPFQSPAWKSVRGAVKAALDRKAKSTHLRASISMVNIGGNTADLLTKATGKLNWEPMIVAASPLFGPIVYNSTLHAVESEKGFDDLAANAAATLTASGLWDNETAVYVTLVYSCSLGEDCVVSSFMASFTCGSVNMYNDAVGRKSTVREIYRYAFGGTSATAFIASVDGDKEAEWLSTVLGPMETFASVKKRPLRRGSIANFVEYTSGSIKQRKAQLEQMKDPQERALSEKMVGPLEKMLQDSSDVLADPENNVPNAYAPDGVLTAASPRVGPNTTSRTPRGASEKTPTEGAAAQNQRAGSPSAGKRLSAIDKSIVVFIGGTTVAVGETAVQLQGKSVTVKEVVSSEAAATVPSAVEASQTLKEAETVFLSGRNCLLVSSSQLPGGADAVAKEPALTAFASILRSSAAACEASSTRYSIDLVVSVNAVKDVMTDLQGTPGEDASGQPIDVKKSPIWGARTANARSTSINSVALVETAVREAFARVTPQALEAMKKGDAVLIATAVQRRAQKAANGDDDVELYTLGACLTGLPTKAYHPTAPSSSSPLLELTNVGLSSGFSTIGVLNLSQGDDAAATGAHSALASFLEAKRASVDRPSSTVQFLKATQVARDQMQKAQAAHPSAAMADRITRVEQTIQDHEQLFKNFNAPLPEYSSSGAADDDASQNARKTDSAVRAAGGNASPSAAAGKTPGASASAAAAREEKEVIRVRTVAVVADNASLGGKVELKVGEDNTVSVVRGSGSESYALTQAVRHTDAKTSPAYTAAGAAEVATLERTLVEGCNGALLVTALPADGDNLDSKFDLPKSLPPLLLRHVVEGISAKTLEMFYSIVLVKGDTHKDELSDAQDKDQYRPTATATSPLFGPIASGVTLTSLHDVDAFAKSYTASYEKATKQQVACVATVVFKQVTASDVLLHSFLIVADPTGGREIAQIAGKDHRHARDLFSYALGGSCRTVAVAALQARLDEEVPVKPLMEAFSTLAKVRLGRTRNGSLRKFVQYAAESTKASTAKLKAASDPSEVADLTTRVQRHKQFLSDGENMLSNPLNIIPMTYDTA